MAVRDDFAAGEVLAAADLNDTFASKLDLAGGKILQIVRATDGTDRSTTSTSYVDVTGMSVTITPQKSDSAILLLSVFGVDISRAAAGLCRGTFRITDASDNPISGTTDNIIGLRDNTASNLLFDSVISMFAYATPATTSATTYKLRFKADSGATLNVRNSIFGAGQMYAMEVSA